MKNLLKYALFLITFNVFLFIYTNKNLVLYSQIKYSSNDLISLYLLLTYLYIFGNYYFYYKVVSKYFELKNEICVRIGYIKYRRILYKLLLLFSLFFFFINLTLDYLLFNDTNIRLLIIDYILLILVNSLVIRYVKRFDIMLVISSTIVFLLRISFKLLLC